AFRNQNSRVVRYGLVAIKIHSEEHRHRCRGTCREVYQHIHPDGSVCCEKDAYLFADGRTSEGVAIVRRHTIREFGSRWRGAVPTFAAYFACFGTTTALPLIDSL